MLTRLVPKWLSVFVCLIVLTGTANVLAQDEITPPPATVSQPNTNNWDQLAEQAERLLDQGEPSEETLVSLREQLVEQRSDTTDMVERGSVAVRALQAQLETLGPPPAEGTTEAEAVAAQRAALIDALATANAPLLAAQQAFERTEVLISEIDRRQRGRSVGEMLVHLPSPLNPFNWVDAATAIWSAMGSTASNLTGAPDDPEAAALANGWLAATLMLCGVMGLWGVHPFVARHLELILSRAAPGARAASVLTLFHLERLFVPMLAGVLIAGGIAIGGVGRLAPELLALLALVPLVVAAANWVGHVAFSPAYPPAQLVDTPQGLATRGVWLSQGLGWALIAQTAAESFYASGQVGGAGYAVLVFLLVLGSAGVLWLLINIVSHSSADTPEHDGQPAIPLFAPLTYLVRIGAVVGIGAAALGYVGVAEQAIFPTISSLCLVVLAMGLYRLLLSLPFIATDASEGGERAIQSAVPLVLGVAIAIALIPALALTWGARVTDISEIWTLAVQGIDMGGLRISLRSLLLMILVFVIGLFVTHWLQVVVRTSVLPRTRADSGVRTAVVTFVGYLGVLLAAFIAASSAGIDLSNLALVAGALSVGIGFGLQSIVANFLSGLILLVERPIKEGDWIEVAGYSGTVKKIAVRSTRIETFDRHDVIIPNSDLISGSVKNMTLGSKVGRVICPVGVAYGSDVERVKALLLEIGTEHSLVLNRPPPVVLLRALGDNALEFELRCFIRDVMETITVKSDLLMAIHARFLVEGVSIPFPQRDVHIVSAAPDNE